MSEQFSLQTRQLQLAVVAVAICIFFPTTSAEVGCLRSETGSEYQGTQNTTSSGRSCVRWDEVQGAFRDYIRVTFMALPDRNASNAINFCRNPNNDSRGVWCFVNLLGNVQFCNVPHCSAATIVPQPAVETEQVETTTSTTTPTTTPAAYIQATVVIQRIHLEQPVSAMSDNELDSKVAMGSMIADVTPIEKSQAVRPFDAWEEDPTPSPLEAVPAAIAYHDEVLENSFGGTDDPHIINSWDPASNEAPLASSQRDDMGDNKIKSEFLIKSRTGQMNKKDENSKVHVSLSSAHMAASSSRLEGLYQFVCISLTLLLFNLQ